MSTGPVGFGVGVAVLTGSSFTATGSGATCFSSTTTFLDSSLAFTGAGAETGDLIAIPFSSLSMRANKP